jgi:hypothetical protein
VSERAATVRAAAEAARSVSRRRQLLARKHDLSSVKHVPCGSNPRLLRLRLLLLRRRLLLLLLPRCRCGGRRQVADDGCILFDAVGSSSPQAYRLWPRTHHRRALARDAHVLRHARVHGA